MRKWIASNLPDAMILSGSALIAYGAWLVYLPAGYLVGGAMLLGFGVFVARGAS